MRKTFTVNFIGVWTNFDFPEHSESVPNSNLKDHPIPYDAARAPS